MCIQYLCNRTEFEMRSISKMYALPSDYLCLVFIIYFSIEPLRGKWALGNLDDFQKFVIEHV